MAQPVGGQKIRSSDRHVLRRRQIPPQRVAQRIPAKAGLDEQRFHFSRGALAQAEAVKEAKKARDQAKDQYEAAQASAEAEASRISNLEEERKRRLALMGTQNPQTLLGGYLGVTGSSNVRRPTLG